MIIMITGYCITLVDLVSTQPIWSKYMCTTSFDRCYGTRNSCQPTSVTNCSHSEDVTIECSK